VEFVVLYFVVGGLVALLEIIFDIGGCIEIEDHSPLVESRLFFVAYLFCFTFITLLWPFTVLQWIIVLFKGKN